MGASGMWVLRAKPWTPQEQSVLQPHSHLILVIKSGKGGGALESVYKIVKYFSEMDIKVVYKFMNITHFLNCKM